jgi:hypothetical protein
VKYVLICDESHTSGRFLVLGALVLPSHNHAMLASELRAWKVAKGLDPAGEFKWTKVSRTYLPLYVEMMEWLFGHVRANHLGVRALVLDLSDALYRGFSQADGETGFYKAYYHLLRDAVRQVWAEGPAESILILMDERRDRYRFQKAELRKALNAAMKREFGVARAVANVEDRVSSGPKAEPLIQVVDVLIGAVGFVRNGLATRPDSSPAKRRLVQAIEAAAGTPLSFDTMWDSPFSLWTFDLKAAVRDGGKGRRAARGGKTKVKRRKRPQA